MTPDNNETPSAPEKNDAAPETGLKAVLTYLQTTDLEYVLLEKGGKKLSLRRNGDVIVSKSNGLEAPPLETKAEPEAPAYFSIRSPIVGRFYSSTGADRPPFVVESGRVTAGQKVAIVEAMKIKKEVFSAVTGKILRIFVRDGDPVEYGQELFSVEPEKEEGE